MLNKPEFKRQANWLQMLTQLIEDQQDNDSPEAQAALVKWNNERDQLRFVFFLLNDRNIQIKKFKLLFRVKNQVS